MRERREAPKPSKMHDSTVPAGPPAAPGIDILTASSTTAAAAVAGSAAPAHQIFLGTFVHSRSREELAYLHNTAVLVDSSGTIVAVEEDCDKTKAKQVATQRLGWQLSGVTIISAKEGQFFFPGFIGQYCPLLLALPLTSGLEPFTMMRCDTCLAMGSSLGCGRLGSLLANRSVKIDGCSCRPCRST
jgi:hypothetical protein